VHSFFILDIFQISRQPQRIRKKTKTPKNFVDTWCLSKVKLDNPLFCLKIVAKDLKITTTVLV